MSTVHAQVCDVRESTRLRDRLNSSWHERGLQTFTLVVLAHWAEHILQAIQIYVWHWPVPQARGVLGYFFPWLVTSESLHYGYALVMLIGIWVFRPGFTGQRDHQWWTIALYIQFWHPIEHALLQTQAIVGHNIFGRPVPTSILQLWLPRVELHLFYNTIVFIPMAIAMYYHMFPTAQEAAGQKCSCAWSVQPAVA